MIIRNLTQFCNFLSSKHLLDKHPLYNRLFECKMSYDHMCVCGGKSNTDKTRKYTECNRIYRESVSASAEHLKFFLLDGCSDNTISFYIDDIHLKTITR